MKWMLIVLSCAVAAPAMAAPSGAGRSLESLIAVGDWTYVGNSDSTVMFVKPAPADGPYARVFVRFEDGIPFTRQDFSSLASLEVDDVDCGGQRTRIVQSIRYAEHNMMGESRADPIDTPVWKSEAPGSFGAGLLAHVCSSFQ